MLRGWLARSSILLCFLVGCSSRSSAPPPPVTTPKDGGPGARATGDASVGAASAVIAKLGSMRFRHGDGVRAMAYSPDGKHLATSDGKTLVIWSASGTIETTIKASGDVLSFSRDNTLAVAGAEGGASVYRLDGGNLWTAAQTDDGVEDLAWSADGERLAIVGRNHAMSMDGIAPAVGLYLLDGETGKPLRNFAFSGGVSSAAFAPDGTLAFATPDEIQLLPPKRSSPFARIAAHGVQKGRFTPDGKSVVWIDGKTIGRYDVIAGRSLPPLAQTASELAISPDGKLIAVTGEDGAKLLDLATGTVVRTFDPAAWPQRDLAFSPDGTQVTATLGTRPASWDVATGALIAEVGHRSWVTSAACTASSIATSSEDGTVILWGLDGSQRAVLAKHVGRVNQVRYNADTTRLVSAGADGHVILWDARTASPIATLTGHKGEVADALFLADGRIASISGTELFIWRDGKLAQQLVADRPLKSLALSRDGSILYAASSDGLLWDTQTLATPRKVDTDDGVAAAFSPDDKWMVVGGSNTLEVVDVRAAKERKAAYTGRAVSVAFSPDGTWLAAAGEASALLEFPSLKPLVKLDSNLTAAAVCPDGEKIVLGGRDGMVTFYSARALLGHH